MGCGTGTLAIPLSRDGHPVIACDFSPAMIERLMEVVEAEDLPVTSKVVAWQDDWHEQGIADKCVDVAIASRSISDAGFRTCIGKLEGVARRSVAITVSSGPVPAYDPQLLEALGRPVPDIDPAGRVQEYLESLGRAVERHHIQHRRNPRFSERVTLEQDMRAMAGAGEHPFTEEEERAFEQYLSSHLAVERDETGNEMFGLDYALMITWAFLKWDVD